MRAAAQIRSYLDSAERVAPHLARRNPGAGRSRQRARELLERPTRTECDRSRPCQGRFAVDTTLRGVRCLVGISIDPSG